MKRKVYDFHQSIRILPYKSFQVISERVSGEKNVFLVFSGGHFGDSEAEISPFHTPRTQGVHQYEKKSL